MNLYSVHVRERGRGGRGSAKGGRAVRIRAPVRVYKRSVVRVDKRDCILHRC